MRAQFTFTVEGETENFDIEVVIEGSRESYGDDADGRRGGYYIEVGEPEYDLPEMSDEDRNLVERDLLKQIERHEWDWE
jgi:hypothetical protein